MRSRVIFLLAIIMAGITTFLFYNYMNQTETKGLTEEVKMTNVVVAKNEIKENQTITAEMLELKQVADEGVHPSTLKDLQEAEGKFSLTTIVAGEVILSHRLQAEKEETILISRKVQDGKRAVTVGVNIVQSVANLIDPEDNVDILFTEIVKEENIEEVKSLLLFEKVRVLAIGRKMMPESNSREQYVEYSSITVELNPDDAMELVNASTKGNLHFTVHSSILPSNNSE
ncbi:Flp pilus assembly protein CpaB [Aquibacillus halophilus]|uniref:Flp pilus assembly protein CpaB n=1 Tax=Aquibacillus halophilus TaxID=930132 RepID=A0A6A8DGG2_9BACI|nr:Flp pilus assembly protein CpaB [Aquibacillus halophilus]MRH44320.1 Flp pilus assembly protein CpaB [Aquibacillus halophilus]